MIPAYTDEPIVLELNGQQVPYEDVDLLMWRGFGGIVSSEDEDKSYEDYQNATTLVIVLNDDTQIELDPATLDGNTTELLSQIAFPS